MATFSFKSILNFWEAKDDKIIAGIKRFPLFYDLTEGDMRELAKKIYIRHFDAEEEIYAEASPSAAIYFILSGSVGIYKKRRSNITDRIQVVQSGKFFGESALVTSSSRKHSVKAMEKTQALVLFKTDFSELEQTHPKLALKFLKYVTTKFYNELNVFQTEFHELSQKVAKDELMR